MAQEAGLLIDVLLERVQQAGRPDPAAACPECGKQPGVRCTTGCPWCAVVAVVRGEPADIPAPVLDSVTTALQTVRSWLVGAAGNPPSAAEQPPPAPGDGKAASGEALQRIDIAP